MGGTPGSCSRRAGRETMPSGIDARREALLLDDGLANHLVDGGLALVDRQEAALAEGAHAALAGLVAQDVRRRLRDDELAQVVVEEHELEQRHPALVAAAVAGIAAATAEEGPTLHIRALEAQLHELFV